VATDNDGEVVLWHPAEAAGTEKRRNTIDEYQAELSELLSVPVSAEAVGGGGATSERPDLLVRRGATDSVRDALFEDRPAVPSPGCTTVTVYSGDADQPGFVRRLAERLTF
jgi:hypothetical protein